MILSADKNNLDGVVHQILSQVDSPISLVAVTRNDNFEFNAELLKLGKYVLFDFCEYGANDWERKQTHLFGENTAEFGYAFKGDEWKRFDDFVRENPPIVIFKREILEKDRRNNLVPIDYPRFAEVPELDDKATFDKRQIELFHYWGWSHESRRVFHGNVWQHAAKNRIYVVDNIGYISNAINDVDSERIWITANIPHYARYDMNIIYSILQHSKLSLSLPGAGVKCFRHSEILGASTLVMQENNLAWSFELEHGLNCIKVPIGDTMEDIRGLNGSPEITAIENALKRNDLYDIYKEGHHLAQKYFLPNYVKDYIQPIINNHV